MSIPRPITKENDVNKTSLAWAACLMFSLVTGLPAQAQSAYPSAPVAYTQQQLDQMLAPVALYPDSLLAQVLMAATYPLEVVQAQRFVEARPGLQGDGLARAVAPMPWDPSVKSLVQFPAVLAMMNDRLDWMQQLGQAFLSQQGNVMDTVQNLRERARIAGTLESSPQQRVMVEDDDVIVIEPVNPQVVYVPYYNPVVVYGSWWWPSAPPVYWTPPPRYRPPSYQPGFTASISFGVGIGVMSAVYGDARPDWHHRQVMVSQTRITNINNTNIVNNRVINNNVNIDRNVTMNQHPVVWHHDARYGGGGRYAQQAAPALAQAQAPRPGSAPAPAPSNVQQRIVQDDQARQRQAFDQQRQREQQANDQQRQREQMIRDQQRQHEQQSQDQRQQQQAQERQMQMQMQQHQQQMQQQQQQREQQLRQRQMQDQQRGQQMQQMRQQQHDQQQRQQQQVRQQQEQAHREQQAHQQAPQPRAQPQPQRNARDDRNGHRDEHRDERG